MKKSQEVINAEKMLLKIEDDFYPDIITPKIDDKHKDSLFYDGTIAEITKSNGTKLFLIAAGDIRIYKNCKGDNGKEYTELVFDGQERNSGFDFELNDDTIHNRIGSNYSDEYYWDMNNWFEVTWKKKDEDFIDSAMGDVAGDYDEAIDLLKSYWEDDEY